MKTLSRVKTYTFTAACMALCVVLPMALHAIPNAGSIISPMHIPVLLCGLVCGGPFGLLCGLVGPALSSLLTGMPPAAYLPAMMVELGIYGLVAGLMMTFLRTKRPRLDLYFSLVVAMLLGRIGAGLVNGFIFHVGSYSLAIWASSYFISAWPAIVIHLVLIPALVVALEKSRLIPQRYPL